MELVGKLLVVGAAGAATFWSAIPVGIALELHPILAGIAATLGNLAAVVLVVVLEGRLRQWIPRYGRFTTQEDRLKRVWTSRCRPAFSPDHGCPLRYRPSAGPRRPCAPADAVDDR